MQSAAQALDFERATLLRDQLVNLRKLQAEQAIDAGRDRDVDAVAIVGEPGDYVVSLLLVRGGRSLGTTSYFPRAALAEPAEARCSGSSATLTVQSARSPYESPAQTQPRTLW